MPRGVRGSGTVRRGTLSLEEARQRREQLQAQMRELEAYDAQRYAVIGRVVAHRAEHDATFATELRELLNREVTDRGERMCVGLPIPRRGGRRSRKAGGEAGLAQPLPAGSDAGPSEL